MARILNEQEYHRLKKKLMAIAVKYGQDSDAEELAHEALATWIARPGTTKQTCNQAIIDALRKRSRFKGPTGDLIKQAMARPIEIDKITEAEIGNEPRRCVERDLDPRREVDRIANLLGKHDRVVFLLSYIWGFTHYEIGYLFNVSESSISVRLKSIQERIQSHMSKRRSSCEFRIRAERARKNRN